CSRRPGGSRPTAAPGTRSRGGRRPPPAGPRRPTAPAAPATAPCRGGPGAGGRRSGTASGDRSSPARPDGVALLGEGARTLLGVLAREDLAGQLRLDAVALLQIHLQAAEDALLRGLHGQGRVGGDAAGPRQGPVGQLLLGNDLVE